MQYSRCQAPRFAPTGFLVTHLFDRARFPRPEKTFRAILAVTLSYLMLVPQPLLAQSQTYSCPTAFGPVAVAPVLPALLSQSLKTAPNPVLPNGPAGIVREDLADLIANQQAAIQLGKAFFWEMQAGSDNKTACATCHFKAGVDGRDRNQMNPGANGTWDGFGYGPN